MVQAKKSQHKDFALIFDCVSNVTALFSRDYSAGGLFLSVLKYVVITAAFN